MPSDPQPSCGALPALLHAFGLAVLKYDPDKDSRALLDIPPPEWYDAIFRSDTTAGDPVSDSLFLQDFFDQAKEHWRKEDMDVPLVSGIWEETGPDGIVHHLQATAIRARSERFLVIECFDNATPNPYRLQQRLNDNALARRALEKEIQKKAILLECIVHDLGSPLATIMLNLQRLRAMTGDSDGESDTRWAIDTAMSQAKRQRKLIRFITDLFAADLENLLGSHLDPDSAPDIAAAAREIADAHRENAATRDIEITLANDLPVSLAGNTRVVGESAHLSRVIDNLVANAVRHSPDRGAVRIRLDAADSSTGAIRLSVEDDGPGVDPAIAGRIFDPHVRGDTTHGQSGLGLHFCQSTISLWGGQIDFENRPGGGGARFWFTLPLASTATPAP